MDREGLAEMLLEVGALKFGDFVLSSGKRSDYYVDIKEACTHPKVLDALTDALLEVLPDGDVLAGPELGAVPLVSVLSVKARLPMAIVRKRKKEYGIGERIIGDVRGQEVVLVDDVATTGGSLLNALETIEEEGGEVRDAVVVVDRQEGAEEALKERGVRLSSVLTADDLRGLRDAESTARG
ncbi:orotate phosphoribosyltransferase [Methanopyrus sp. SNP6]|uniref:orotate phosphoribosyltransferase n=1 Tax=Methanopyrus sp. SNP6 TaxID=1937005 RepID=UPI001F001AF0|nr:orotate phosphoribosyltransferase [Methanopyrus sp. SNP6]